MPYPERKTTRIPGYDYRNTGYYFITICTQNKQNLFGQIQNDKVQPSAQGKIVSQNWLDIPNHHSGITLDAFILMPNHLHGIIMIHSDRSALIVPGQSSDVAGYVPTGHASFISPKSGSLSAVIRSFKSACTKRINEESLHKNPIWQSRFYEHVIRDENDLHRIRMYIENNPLRWSEDEFFRASGIYVGT